ncbi:hypothetical protein FACS1894102_5780 [Spirochaetia bacterium]|nr:hypothetical protein FACS1894102_5780 [Spirochaetia bacterium]
MGILNVVLLVLFVIVAILLVLLVLVQTEDGDSLGGVFAGGSSTAFGSRSGNILTKTSSVLGAVFLILSFSLALLNRTPRDTGVEEQGRKAAQEQTSDWWDTTDSTTENVLPEAQTDTVDTVTEDVLNETETQDVR